MMKNVKFPVEIKLNKGKIEKINAADVNELDRMYVEHGMAIECEGGSAARMVIEW